MRTEKSGWTAALLILQIAVGAMLAVGGIWALQGGGDFAARAIKGLVSGNAGNILVIVFGVIELLVGVFMILKIVIGDRFGSFGTVLALIAIIVWIIAIVLSDISSKIIQIAKQKARQNCRAFFIFLFLQKVFLEVRLFQIQASKEASGTKQKELQKSQCTVL